MEEGPSLNEYLQGYCRLIPPKSTAMLHTSIAHHLGCGVPSMAVHTFKVVRELVRHRGYSVPAVGAKLRGNCSSGKDRVDIAIPGCVKYAQCAEARNLLQVPVVEER